MGGDVLHWGVSMKFFDGLRNFASGLGTAADKSRSNVYVRNYVDDGQAIAAYETSWFGKIVNIRAEDSVRKWRAWVADDAQIELIENEEKRLGVKHKIMEADRMAMVRGGAAIYMKLPGNPAIPVNWRTLGEKGLEYLTVLAKDQITPDGKIRNDPNDEFFGHPERWKFGDILVHPSRVIRFVGAPRMDGQNSDPWGISLWAMMRDPVSNLDAASAGVAAMTQEAKIDVISVPGLMDNLSTAEYENLLIRRFTIANNLKSIVNALIIDGGNSDGKGGETFQTKTMSFGSLPDVLDRFMILLSGMADTPQTRLYGRAPQGMNATGDADAENYAALIGARQELYLQPTIRPMDDALIASALGSRPPEIWYMWRSLKEISEKDAAAAESSFATAFKARVETAAINSDVLGKAELSRMVETGRYPGIEQAISESENDGIVDPEEQAEIDRMEQEAALEAGAQNAALAS
jgi:uncharacterized protein